MTEKQEYYLYKIILIIVFVLVVLVLIEIIRRDWQRKETHNLLQHEANKLCKKPDVERNAKDLWSNQLRYNVVINEKLIVAIVESSGPDGIWETDDDLKDTATDFNKSRIVGEWAGQKSKQVVRGFIDGLKKKGNFD